MPHGVTWFNLFPSYARLQAYVAVHCRSLFGSGVVLQHVYAAVLVALLMLVLGLYIRLQLKRLGMAAVIPEAQVSLLNILEVVFGGLYQQMQEIIGNEAAKYFGVLSTLALFIFMSNILGLFPGFTPPTDNWNTTFACGIFVFLYYNYLGLRKHGLQHIAHIANPAGTWWGWFLAPLMFPIEVVSHLARPFSLGVRLASNMLGDHAVLTAFLGLLPILIPIPFLLLGLLVAIIQTLVFILLAMIYISLAIGDSDHKTSTVSAH